MANTFGGKCVGRMTNVQFLRPMLLKVLDRADSGTESFFANIYHMLFIKQRNSPGKFHQVFKATYRTSVKDIENGEIRQTIGLACYKR